MTHTDNPPESNQNSDDLEDQPDPGSRKNWRVTLSHPVVLKGIIALFAGLFVLIGTDRRGALFLWTVAIALIGYALVKLYGTLRLHRKAPYTVLNLIGIGIAVSIAVTIVFWPKPTFQVIGMIIGIGLILAGPIEIIRGIRERKTSPDWSWRIIKGILAISAGLLVINFPETILVAILMTLAGLWIMGAIGVILLGFQGKIDEVDVREASAIIMSWLKEREFTAEERKTLVEKLFFEGTATKRRLFRFSVLMALSVIIATLGIVSNSTAVVIGAMLIAPLMTPIMALAASLIMGWPRRAALSGLIISGSALGSIILSGLVSSFVPMFSDIMTNTQIISRTSPTLIDLMIALTAGAAGAFAMSRPDVSDSLPGVAVAVALVPPLAVIGVTMQAGAYGEASGALLLFLTNLVAMILAGASVFVLVGFTPFFRLQERIREIRISIGTVAIGAIIVVIPLMISGQSLIQDATTEDITETAIAEWLGEKEDFDIVSVKVDGSDIEILLAGPSDPPPVNKLGNILDKELNSPFNLNVNWVLQTNQKYSSPK